MTTPTVPPRTDDHAERIKPKPELDRLLELWVILATLGILEGVKH